MTNTMIETAILNNEGFYNLISGKLTRQTYAIEKLMNATKKSLFEISARLLIIKEEELYIEDGFKDVYEYAEQILGYKKVMVYKMIQTAENFIEEEKIGKKMEYVSVIKHYDKDYSLSQLMELNTVDIDKVKLWDEEGTISPDMTVKEIRDIVKSTKRKPEDIIEEQDETETETTQDAEEQGDRIAEAMRDYRESFERLYSAMSLYFDNTLTDKELLKITKPMVDGFNLLCKYYNDSI